MPPPPDVLPFDDPFAGVPPDRDGKGDAPPDEDGG